MFIWDFVASTVMDAIIDWVYDQIIGFLGNFFAAMGNMGVELFEMEWVQYVVQFFNQLGWALFTVSLVVCAFECAIEYSNGRGNGMVGKVWRDGLCGPCDLEQAELWFRRSAEAGNDYSQYALGKLLQGQRRVSEALLWYEKAAEQRNQYANYRLGKLYLQGEDVPRDVDRTVAYLTASAEAGNQYAQYTLGKLYILGKDVVRDRELAQQYLTAAAEQGNEYAQFFLDRFDQYRDPSVLLCASKLLYHMSRIFRQNSVPPTNPAGIRIDSKRRKALLEKRLAMGHKIDDHENQKMQ